MAYKSKSAKKKSGRSELLSWVFDLGFLAGLIFFFSSSANSFMAWHWVCTSLEGPAVSLVSSLPSKFGGEPTPERRPEPPLASPVKVATTHPPVDPVIEDQPSTSPDENNANVPAPAPKPKPIKIVRGNGKPIQFGKGKIKGVPFYQTIINLKDPETFLVVGLPKGSNKANCPDYTVGHENFDALVKRFPGAVVVNGTFFSKDEQERVMGNVVSRGKFLKYSQWENYGTTLGLKAGNEPEMVTARSEGQPDWQQHWFSLTCGPRLVKDGEVWLAPDIEGFTDDHVLGIGPRAAIGFPKSKDKLYIITFMQGLSLEAEAKLMKELGCYQAMNLDGGASKALARDGKVMVTPGRALTNVIVVYDTKHPAPDPVVASWMHFQEDTRAEGI